MEKILLGYGPSQVKVAFDGAKSVTYLEPAAEPAIEDVKTAFYDAAVLHPTGGEPLDRLVSAEDLVTIVISDITRFWSRQDLVCRELVAFLRENCGVPYENMAVLVALGTHRGQSEAELRQIASEEVYQKVQVVCHDCEGKLSYLGETSFGTPVWVNPLGVGRKVITIGATVHHLMSGYGGGRKSILPGISGKQTILHNHMMCLDPERPRSSDRIGMGKLEDNPVHLDMTEAASMVGPVFGINIVMNKDGRQCRLVCGQWQQAWEESCRLVQQISGVPIREKADIVIASCGGYPKDINLYQGIKTLLNMGQAVKPGGTMIFIAQCPDGGGAPDFFDWSRSLKTNSLDADLRAGFTIAGYIFYAGCEVIQNGRVMMLTELSPETLQDMGIEGYTDMKSLLAAVDFSGKDVIVMPHGGSTVPYVSR
ncbi:MAG TPA: nickel-dependent lactate racemase [Ruminococcaceae bacterium]|nr:nickel-dependent lactate racemase [Oscillospiraceae bacterium]